MRFAVETSATSGIRTSVRIVSDGPSCQKSHDFWQGWLWEALDADLLVPFHYFGVADDVDLSQVEWKRGNYDITQLDTLYTGNDARAAKVIAELRDKVTSTSDMRALGFCVSVQHAHYMAEVFNRAGIASLAVSGETPEAERAAALRKLRDRELNCLFAVDLFNEGLDLP